MFVPNRAIWEIPRKCHADSRNSTASQPSLTDCIPALLLTAIRTKRSGSSDHDRTDSGAAGVNVTITGTAWPPGDLIKLSWDFNWPVTLGSARADGNGTFTATITVPQGAPLGPTYIDAINQEGDRTGQAPFTVVTHSSGLSPGWHSNDGRNSLMFESITNDSGLRILLGNTYVYESPVVDPLYWYVQILYINASLTQSRPINCAGRTDPSIAKEHMQGTGNAGAVAADETFCSRNPTFSGQISPGGTHYEWAIFHNVPWGGKDSLVRIEWDPYTFSDWFKPWDRPYPKDVPPPAGCPPELVSFGKCREDSTRQPMKVHLSRTPEGKAPNLVVLVHGCCTTYDQYLKEMYQQRGDALISAIVRTNIAKKTKANAWEIVVRDWSNFTPPFTLDKVFQDVAKQAYDAAAGQGDLLEKLIARYAYYKYVHLIGHNAGARLIDQAATMLSLWAKKKPFIHLTFLDAYTPLGDQVVYGMNADYAEHYVDRGPFFDTDQDLANAFNFNVTDWKDEKDSAWREGGHQWPLRWYTRSINIPKKTGLYGFKLSLEGGNDTFSVLAKRFAPGGVCALDKAAAHCGNP